MAESRRSRATTLDPLQPLGFAPPTAATPRLRTFSQGSSTGDFAQLQEFAHQPIRAVTAFCRIRHPEYAREKYRSTRVTPLPRTGMTFDPSVVGTIVAAAEPVGAWSATSSPAGLEPHYAQRRGLMSTPICGNTTGRPHDGHLPSAIGWYKRKTSRHRNCDDVDLRLGIQPPSRASSLPPVVMRPF